jgi:hypothetical protein
MSNYLHKIFTLSVFDTVQGCIYNIYRPLSFQARYSRLCPCYRYSYSNISQLQFRRKQEHMHFAEKRLSFIILYFIVLLQCVDLAFVYFILLLGPPLWSSDQSSWLQIRRPGFNSRNYLIKKVVGLERGPLILVSTTEELLDRKVGDPV